jgi:hypothetical protein
MENIRIKDLNYAKKGVIESYNIKNNKPALKSSLLYSTNINPVISKRVNVISKSNTRKSPSINKVKKPNNTLRKELTYSCETKRKNILASTSQNKINTHEIKSPRFCKNSINSPGRINSPRHISFLNSTTNKSFKEKSSKSSSVYSRTKQTSSSISSNQLNYQTELDLNSIVDKKFYNEACEIGKKNLSTKGSKLSSTNRTINEVGVRNKAVVPNNDNNSTFLNSKMNFTSYNFKKPSESVLVEMIDLQYSQCSPERKKICIEKSKLEEKRSDLQEKLMNEEDKTINLSFNRDSSQDTLLEAFECFYYYIGKDFTSLQISEKIDRAINSRYNCRKACR